MNALRQAVVEAAHAAKEKIAFGAFPDGIVAELIVQQPIGHFKLYDAVGCWIYPCQPFIGAYPDIAVVIFLDAVDDAVRKPVFYIQAVEYGLAIINIIFVDIIQPVAGANPHTVLPVCIKRKYIAVGQAAGIAAGAECPVFPGFPVQHPEAAKPAGYPYALPAVCRQRSNGIIFAGIVLLQVRKAVVTIWGTPQLQMYQAAIAEPHPE